VKKITTFAFVTIALVLSLSASAQEKQKWPEMDSFHTVMAQTFHPAEEGKFEPVKSRSHEIVVKAMAWQNSTPPAGYDKSKVEMSLANLVTGAKQLEKLIKGHAANALIKQKLSSLHDTFHEIMEKCEKEDQH